MQTRPVKKASEGVAFIWGLVRGRAWLTGLELIGLLFQIFSLKEILLHCKSCRASWFFFVQLQSWCEYCSLILCSHYSSWLLRCSYHSSPKGTFSCLSWTQQLGDVVVDWLNFLLLWSWDWNCGISSSDDFCLRKAAGRRIIWTGRSKVIAKKKMKSVSLYPYYCTTISALTMKSDSLLLAIWCSENVAWTLEFFSVFKCWVTNFKGNSIKI